MEESFGCILKEQFNEKMKIRKVNRLTSELSRRQVDKKEKMCLASNQLLADKKSNTNNSNNKSKITSSQILTLHW